MPNTEQTKIAVLEERQKNMLEAINRIEETQVATNNKIDKLQDTLACSSVSNKDFNEYKAAIRTELKALNDKHRWRIVSTILISTIITSLIAYFISDISGK